MKWFLLISGILFIPASLWVFSTGDTLMGWNVFLHGIAFIAFAMYRDIHESKADNNK